MRDPICQRDFANHDLRAHGCTLAGLAYLMREMGGASWTEDSLARLQRLSGASKADFLRRGTTVAEAQVAYMASTFEGRTKPRTQLLRGVDVKAGLLPLLRGNDLYAGVAVNYGAAVDAGEGVGSFRGGHFIVITDPTDHEVTVIDSLRRQPTKWPIWVLVKAMETFGKRPWGNGRGEALVAYPSPTFLEVARRQRDEARKALAACEAKPPVPADQAALDAAYARGKADESALYSVIASPVYARHDP